MLYEKVCCACKQAKPLTEYHKNKGRKDGLSCNCKVCAIAISREWRLQHPDYYKPKLEQRRANPIPFRIRERINEARNAEKARAQAKLRRERFPERFKEYGQRERIKHAAKIKVRKILQNEVREGRIIKPDTCEDCKKKFPKRLMQSHHDDYTKPLDVKWLCRKCHSKRHRKYTDVMLADRCENNLRAMLSAIESGEMLK